MKNITMEALMSMDNKELMLITRLKEMLDKANKDFEFLKMKIKFSFGQYRFKYEVTPAPDPKNPMLLLRPNCGEVTHAGVWRFEDHNKHLPLAPLSNVSSANVCYEVKLSVEGIFSLYRAKAMVDMGLQLPAEDGYPEYINEKYKHFQDFVSMAGDYKFI